jgi:4-hydroxybenzoate polyprenyltransferase
MMTRASRRAVATAVGLLQTTRVPTALLMGCTVALPAAVITDHRLAAMMALPFFLAALGGFALNDYYDAGKDCINNPHRAIPSRRLMPRTVLIVALALLSAALSSAVYRSAGVTELLLYLGFILGMWCYNALAGRLALLKTVYTAGVSSLLVWYDVVVLRHSATSSLYYLFPVATLLFIAGRELLMDIRDVPGDRAAGATTIPMILGEGPTAGIAFLLQVVGALLLLPVAITISPSRNALLLLFALVAIGGATWAWRVGAGRYRRPAIHLLWVPMLVGVLMLAA